MVRSQTRCVVVRGEAADASTLNYFRNAIGLLTAMLDAGGVAIYDLQILKWWSAEEWREDVFEADAPSPRTHVVILGSEEDDGSEWMHTRGMRKFGRPDLSVHHVPPQHRAAIVELINRFIEFQAFGGTIDPARPIKMQSIPAGMRCVHGGDVDDPDFNNEHVEICWPLG